jgi:hypothetical protein
MMKKAAYSYLVAIACLSAAVGLGAGTAQFPTGIAQKPMDEIKPIEKTFASITEAAFSKNGFGDVIDRLAHQDRTRLNHEKESSLDESNDALAQKVDQLKRAWKNRYGKDFAIESEKAYDDFLNIQTGEVDDPGQLAGKWPAPAEMSEKPGGQASAQGIKETTSPLFGGDVKLEKGRDVALVEVPGANGVPTLTASMVHETDGWKFDIPNFVTRQQLHDLLLNNLSYLYDHQDQWPADANEAYRQATRYIVASAYAIDLSHLVNQARTNVIDTGNGTANSR